MTKKSELLAQLKVEDLKQRADGLGVPVDELLGITLEVMRSGTPVQVIPVDGKAVVKKFDNASQGTPKP